MIKTFNDVITEHFDIHDNKTRKVLLALDETDQSSVLNSLTSKLYDNIVEKVDDIDFGDIPKTKGDITLLPSYDKITGCIKTLTDILVEYKQNTEPVDTISIALENLKSRRDLFTQAYRYEVELPMIVYNTIALSVISSVSLMIATSIEFIKQPGSEGFDLTLDKVSLEKTKNSLLFSNLRKFNKTCSNGELDNSLNPLIKSKIKNFTGVEIGFAGATVATITLLFAVIPIIRELIFFFFYTRTRVSDYFDLQADLLQINAGNIDSTRIKSEPERKKIISRQLKIAGFFRKLANKISVTSKESEVHATKEIVAKAKEKQKIDDVVKTMPDSAASSALF